MSQIQMKLPSESFKALQLLMKGNQRFLAGVRSVDMNFSIQKLKEFAEKGQSPFSIVLTCADSRVPVETIFDLGLGDVFVIRVAGNVISPDLIASVEYAAQQFKTALCVVMGHTGCGAVQAAIQFDESENGISGLSEHGKGLIQKILPSVREAKELTPHGQKFQPQSAVLMNIRRNASLLVKSSHVINNLISDHKFAVIGAIYDLHTGKVEFDFEKEAYTVPTDQVASVDKFVS